MSPYKTLSEIETLEQYRVALENAENQPEIATIMADFGYDKATIAIGKALLTETRTAFDFNKKEDDETTESYRNFITLRKELLKMYTLHRKKAKVVFRKEPSTLEKLTLTGSLPSAYLKRLEVIKKFYTVALADTAIQTKLARLKMTKDEIAKANQQIAQLEVARTTYLREKGESQSATKTKDKAFVKINDWMSEFYAVARIALENKPQLLESIGKFVRS